MKLLVLVIICHELSHILSQEPQLKSDLYWVPLLDLTHHHHSQFLLMISFVLPTNKTKKIRTYKKIYTINVYYKLYSYNFYEYENSKNYICTNLCNNLTSSICDFKRWISIQLLNFVATISFIFVTPNITYDIFSWKYAIPPYLKQWPPFYSTTTIAIPTTKNS